MSDNCCAEFRRDLLALEKEEHTSSEVRSAYLGLAEKYQDKLTGPDFLELTKSLLLQGYLTDAERFCHRALDFCDPGSLATLNVKYLALFFLSHIAAACANHALARTIYLKVLAAIPEYLGKFLWYYVYLASYDIAMSARKQKTLSEWNVRGYAKSRHTRPKAAPLHGRPLRVGYVSGDLKIHPVGLLLYGVMGAHNREAIEPFAYSTLELDDNSVTRVIKEHCTFRDVSALDDDAMEDRIREDNIDVLVDLSGYTDGHRLPVFAREPAPCMVSWLGYWSTTGLRAMDAVILDPWHAPENAGYEKGFSESVYRLPCVRFCFRPAQNTPDISPHPPVLDNGHVTFGCFNNTMKYSGQMFRAWAEILQRIPDSRLVLKWKTFHDEAMCDRVCRSFKALGIAPERIELRGMSSYVDMLKEYADIDIALDTFPFSGGMTTCNALWQGVPLVTLAGNTVAGRQGHAILHAIDLPDFSAHNVEHYVNIACGLADNKTLLTVLHATMRYRMLHSSFMDVEGFTRHLEHAFHALYCRRLARDHA
ncbi:MAG: hypothetical protein IJU65_12050 [Desulfovibrio sp.]|nr:hypothetical protein [Desulfovibrio sp.]